MSKNKDEYENYLWHDELETYCLATKDKKFIEPLQPLKLSTIEKSSLAESLQAIYYNRTGKINREIGLHKEYDIELAKVMGCW